MTYKTAAIDQIAPKGGYNISEFNIQDHRPAKHPGVNFSEQRRTHERYAGRNPFNPPGATGEKVPQFGKVNEAYGWREQTLQAFVPAQVPVRERTFAYQAAFSGEPERFHMPRAIRHGFASNDPTLAHLLDELQVAPMTQASHWSQSDDYLHADIGIPSTRNQNYLDNPTRNQFPVHEKTVHRGKHDHHNMLEDRGLKAADLARMLKKTPSEISKWLTGTHTFTTKTITKIETVLGEDIIHIEAQKEIVYFKIYVKQEDELEETSFENSEVFATEGGLEKKVS